jgi:phosphoserine phosphatase
MALKNKCNIKLVFFDMEGQIFEPHIIETKKGIAPSIWTVISRHLGPKAAAEGEATKDKWGERQYACYVDWMEDVIHIHQKYGLTKNVFYNIVNKVKYIKGVEETIKELRKRGYIVAVISGGFKNLADRAIRDLGIHHVFAACEYFFDEKTKKLKSWNLMPCDYQGKVDFMRLLIKEHGLKAKQCAFVGDGVNDISLAKECCISIAFNGRKELQEVTTYAVNQKEKDLRGILKYLQISRNFVPPLSFGI